MIQEPSLRSFRLVCEPAHVALVESLLEAQGFRFDPDPVFSLARRLTHEPFSLGSSLAFRFGYLYIQDRSSMLPPLALAPSAGSAALDMCASPGGKTGLLGQLVGKRGFVLGNEPSGNRLITLRRNLRMLNLLQCATAAYPGEKLPLPSAGADYCGWEHILLDPPCSGWGTAEKHPQVMRLWQGSKIKPLIALQRRLLEEATRLLRPGGRLVYSTCTTNAEENEEQVSYACDMLGMRFLPLPSPAGIDLAEALAPRFDGAWRVKTGPGGQGFFVALLQKPNNGEKPPPKNPPPPGGTGGKAETTGCGGRQEGSPARYAGKRSFAGPHEDQGDFAQFLPLNALDAPGVDAGKLPPGDIAVFNGMAHFLPAAGKSLVSPEKAPRFHWKGFPLGKTGMGGSVRVWPWLHRLMPDLEQAAARNFTCLAVDDCEPVLALLSGRSLTADGNGTEEVGLYFRGLPLCRLSRKGSRVILPPA